MDVVENFSAQKAADEKLAKRFWAKVRKGPDCWEWTGSLSTKRYGRIVIEGKNRGASHVAVYFSTGTWPPPGMQVCHHCDNPPCVRPDHLFVGTARDNSLDMVAKGRHGRRGGRGKNVRRGVEHPRAKLTEAQVLHIRSCGEPDTVLAKRYGVTRKAVEFARKGINWRHLNVETAA